jgi:AraC-like DNA-binding protein
VTGPARYEERAAPAAHGTVWRSTFAGDESVIVPDGCMDLLWTGETLLIAGADSHARVFAPGQGGSMVGLRFWPGILPQLLRTRADHLVDRVVDLDSVIGIDARRWETRLAAAGDPAVALVDLVSAAVADLVPDQRPVRVAADLSSGLPIARTAARTGYSPRQLQRLAAQWYGYRAKHLQRVLRLRKAERLLAVGHTRAEAAAAAGYSDASHLWRDEQALDKPQLTAANRSTGLSSGSVTTA